MAAVDWSVMRSAPSPPSGGRTRAGRTGRATSRPGFAFIMARYSSRTPRKPPEWAVPPVAAGALALFDDGLDGAYGGVDAGDRLELGPPEEGPSRLCGC